MTDHEHDLIVFQVEAEVGALMQRDQYLELHGKVVDRSRTPEFPRERYISGALFIETPAVYMYPGGLLWAEVEASCPHYEAGHQYAVEVWHLSLLPPNLWEREHPVQPVE